MLTAPSPVPRKRLSLPVQREEMVLDSRRDAASLSEGRLTCETSKKSKDFHCVCQHNQNSDFGRVRGISPRWPSCYICAPLARAVMEMFGRDRLVRDAMRCDAIVLSSAYDDGGSVALTVLLQATVS